MREMDDLFAALAKSRFRAKSRLSRREREYFAARGMQTILEHARKFIDERIAPANLANDGKQTPFRNHPVFVAQHATATCCRGCLEKWHRIPRGRELNEQERQYVVSVIERWLSCETDRR